MLSSIIGLNFFIGAGVWALVNAVVIHLISHRRLVGADAAIGVVTTTSFAVGVAVVSTYRKFTLDFEAALFGNLLGITPADLWVIAVTAAAVAVAMVIIRRQLLFSTFDPEVAPVYGISTSRTELLFVLLLAVTIVASTRILGVTLVSAAVVIPPVIGRYLTQRFHTLLIITPIIGALCAAAGMYASYFLDLSSGAMIVLTFALVFFAVGGAAVAAGEGLGGAGAVPEFKLRSCFNGTMRRSNHRKRIGYRLALVVAAAMAVAFWADSTGAEDGADRTVAQAAGTLEVRVKDHRDAIDDFRSVELRFGRLRLAPDARMRSTDPGWLELAPQLDRMDLTRYKDGSAAATVYRGALPPGRFAAVDLQVTGIRGILRKTGTADKVKNAVAPIRLGFEIKPATATVVILDLDLLDLSDHPGRGYELLIKGYELYENDRLLQKIPPG